MKISRLSMILSLAAILCFGTADVSAQRKVLDRKTYMDATQGPKSNVYEAKRTVNTVIEEYKDGAAVLTATRVYQYLAEDNYRFFDKTVSYTGSSSEVERIRVGHYLYSREDDGPWKKEDLRIVGRGSSTGSAASAITPSQYTVETVFLGGVIVDLYEQFIVRSEENGLVFTEDRLWIGHDGALLQDERVEGALSPRVETRRTIRKYDYNPNFKIEAPIP